MHTLRSLSCAQIEAYDRVLRRAARRCSGCDHAAEEIAQEVWLEAFRRPPGHLGNLAGWLRVAAVRAAWRLSRREASRRYRERAVARPEHAPESSAERERLRAHLTRAIGELGEPYGPVLQLFYEEGLDGPRIARRLGRSENTVRCQMRRGLERLRRARAAGRLAAGS